MMEYDGGKVNLKALLTSMNDSSLMPKFIEEPVRKISDDKEKVVIETLYRLDIDPKILENQIQEIYRLNDLLNRYIELEEQGLLLRLPCKVGDTVYRVSPIGRDNIGKLRFKIIEDEFDVYQLTAIGTVIFLTREAAEQKLKEMEENV